MSTDHIFAAQMWSWADPMIKRDSHGRILVVNAAFLQLYGGTIESWTGNPIQGWPTPNAPGEVSRFESRIPLPTGGETVYDWLESSLADGTALAMARDVSAYAKAALPQSAPSLAPATPEIQPAVQAAEPQAAAPVPAEPAAPPTPPMTQADTAAELASLSPMAQAARTPQSEPTPQAAPPEAPEAVPEQAETLRESDNHPVVAPLPLENIPMAQAAEPADNAREPRDFERRPLPIENGDAILGNNWRDAVIAKAVGVEDAGQQAANAEAAAAVSKDAAPAKPTDQIRVLLAEDNAINALLTRTLLEAEGCICDVVEDGVLSVEAVKNNEYHMVFMDMRMPNMDGLEATRKIRAMGYGADVLPIVALTANAFDDDRNACFDSGMNDFMTKPVSAEELSAMVAAHTNLEAQKMTA